MFSILITEQTKASISPLAWWAASAANSHGRAQSHCAATGQLRAPPLGTAEGLLLRGPLDAPLAQSLPR